MAKLDYVVIAVHRHEDRTESHHYFGFYNTFASAKAGCDLAVENGHYIRAYAVMGAYGAPAMSRKRLAGLERRACWWRVTPCAYRA